mgnify:CR=1 FL=1
MEVINDGHNGHLVDFFDQDAWLMRLEQVLAEPERQASIRLHARQTIVEGYDLKSHCLPQQLALVDQVARLSC